MMEGFVLQAIVVLHFCSVVSDKPTCREPLLLPKLFHYPLLFDPISDSRNPLPLDSSPEIYPSLAAIA
jgi:hypothetical protein